MAHPCIECGSECYCSGDIDDIICCQTPISCEGCGCDDFAEDQGWNDHEDFEEDFGDDDYFHECSQCDGHDACADFGCAIEAGIPINPLNKSIL